MLACACVPACVHESGKHVPSFVVGMDGCVARLGYVGLGVLPDRQGLYVDLRRESV